MLRKIRDGFFWLNDRSFEPGTLAGVAILLQLFGVNLTDDIISLWQNGLTSIETLGYAAAEAAVFLAALLRIVRPEGS